MQPLLDDIDLAFGYELTHYCRITTVGIAAEHMGVSKRVMRKRLGRLVRYRWVSALTAWCSDLGPITAPLFAWKPGDEEPDFGAISYQAIRRWEDVPVRKTTVYAASRKMLAYYGLSQRKHISLTQASHDIGCTRMYWYAATRWPEFTFRGEDLFEKRGFGQGVEDAQLVLEATTGVEADRIVHVLEHAGSYRPERCKHFHEHVPERGLSYFVF